VGGADTRERFDGIRIAIIGRPNVGKSSIVNAILGEERTIVSEIPGTTRDAIDTPFTFEGHEMQLVDTAGIRRRGKVERGVERHSVQRAQAAIDRADVVFLVIDREEAITAQDMHIAGYAVDHAKGLVLVVNKWDLSEPGTDRHQFAKRLDDRYRFAPWAPILFTSAIRGQGVVDLLQAAVHIADVRSRRVQTAELNRTIHRATSKHAPPMSGTRRLKVLYATQADVSPPTFVVFVNDPELVHFSYRRYIENQIREAFDFEGTAIRLLFRRRSEDRAEASA
jgi:GTP-binding protein